MADVLERGDIWFLYRPRVDEDDPDDLGDVARTYVVLRPRDADRYRLLVVGRKRLPDVDEPGQERNWAFVAATGTRPEDVTADLGSASYATATRGVRERSATRPAGEGVYVIARHGDHTHLAYALELPDDPGEAQGELQIEPRASYVVTVKRPDASSPPGVGLSPERSADLPDELEDRFDGRRFTALDPPAFLDHEGVELVLVGAAERPERELGIELDPQDESVLDADVFSDLDLDREARPIAPLVQGTME